MRDQQKASRPRTGWTSVPKNHLAQLYLFFFLIFTYLFDCAGLRWGTIKRYNGSHQEGLVGVQDGDIVTRENVLETTRLQLAGVVLKTADEVLEFGTVHGKFKFSGVQGGVWDQTAPFFRA